MAVSFLTDMLHCERLARIFRPFTAHVPSTRQFAYTAFTAGPVGATRIAAGFTHRQFHGMELVPDSTVEPLAYVAKCPQLYVDIGAVFSQTLSEWHFSHRFSEFVLLFF